MGEFIFNYNAYCVSQKFTTFSCLHVSPKWLLMWFIISVVLERTVKSLTTVDVVIEEYNCLPNSKWLCVKHISTKQMAAKNMGGGGGASPAPPAPPKSTTDNSIESYIPLKKVL